MDGPWFGFSQQTPAARIIATGVPEPAGGASAQSTAQNASGSVATTAQSPAGGAGGAASAIATAAVGSGSATLGPIKAGQTVSNATLTPGGGRIVGVGAMSAGYGGSGQSLTYSAEADFSFTTGAPEELYLTLIDNNASESASTN